MSNECDIYKDCYKQWENKKTRHGYTSPGNKRRMLYKTSLVPGCLVRYADDFVIITDTCARAEHWKAKLQIFLQNRLKLTLSAEKALITGVRRKHIKFLGYEFKMIPGNSKKGYITKTIPDRDFEPHPVKRTEKKYKSLCGQWQELLVTFYAAMARRCFSIGVRTPKPLCTR